MAISFRFGLAAVFLGAAALSGLAQAAPAAAPTLEQMQAAAKSAQSICEKKGEDGKVCACGIGIAYVRLDPRVFVAAPDLEPILDEKDMLKILAGVSAAANKNNLTLSDAQKAYDAVKANRQSVKEICKPLKPEKK